MAIGIIIGHPPKLIFLHHVDDTQLDLKVVGLDHWPLNSWEYLIDYEHSIITECSVVLNYFLCLFFQGVLWKTRNKSFLLPIPSTGSSISESREIKFSLSNFLIHLKSAPEKTKARTTLNKTKQKKNKNKKLTKTQIQTRINCFRY